MKYASKANKSTLNTYRIFEQKIIFENYNVDNYLIVNS